MSDLAPWLQLLASFAIVYQITISAMRMRKMRDAIAHQHWEHERLKFLTITFMTEAENHIDINMNDISKRSHAIMKKVENEK